MGIRMNLVCPACKEAFSWKEGTGEGMVALHCDKCGKELLSEKTDRKAQEQVACDCGGVFRTDAPLMCPKCGAVIDRGCVREEYVMEW